MKKMFILLAVFLIAASTIPKLIPTQIYLPIVVKSEATPSPTPTITPTSTPWMTLTSTPAPGVPPEITFFSCNYISPYLYCYLDIKNVDQRPISDVVIDIYYDYQYGRRLNSGPGWIQPDATYSFSWNDYLYSKPQSVSAGIISWVVH